MTTNIAERSGELSPTGKQARVHFKLPGEHPTCAADLPDLLRDQVMNALDAGMAGWDHGVSLQPGSL